MTFFQWRRFNFFDVQRDVDKGNLSTLLQVMNISVNFEQLGGVFKEPAGTVRDFLDLEPSWLSAIALMHWPRF